MNTQEEELHSKLSKIQSIFDVKKVLSIKTDLHSIARYYKINKIPYTIFHHGNDFIHMGISRHTEYSDNDLLEQAALVKKYSKKMKATNILELATGRGASSAYLAKKYPHITFHAIDLPNGQLDYAIKKSQNISNFFPIVGDYHNLHQYKNNSFDIVFIIEALCYSTKKEIVYKEIKRILKPGGIFIIFDGYAGKKYNDLTEEEILGKKLVEKGMIVENFDFYPDFRSTLLHSGFRLVEEENASFLILPTLKKFERQASQYFSLPKILLKAINTILPHEFLYNAISGYLMPTLIKSDVAQYIITVVKS